MIYIAIFTLSSDYYSNTVGIILTAAILYDFLFRASISFNTMFLEEIWSRNFTNLFIAPIKIRNNYFINFNCNFKNFNRIGACSNFSHTFVWCLTFSLGLPLLYLLISSFVRDKSWTSCFFWLLRFGPSFENIAWASLFFFAPLDAFITRLKFCLTHFKLLLRDFL